MVTEKGDSPNTPAFWVADLIIESMFLIDLEKWNRGILVIVRVFPNTLGKTLKLQVSVDS